MTEQWRGIVGWDRRYEVSDLGRVRSKDMCCGARNNTTMLRKGRILKPVCKQGRYLAVTLADGLTREQHLINVLVLNTFVGPKPSGFVARHLDGDMTNNILNNLRWGTHQENADDRVAHGRSGRGEAHPLSKLTEAQVLEIRAATNISYRELGSRYGTSADYVETIRSRRVWKHI